MSDKIHDRAPIKSAASRRRDDPSVAEWIGDELEQTKCRTGGVERSRLAAVAELEELSAKRARREAEEEGGALPTCLCLRRVVAVVDHIGRAIEAAQKNSDAETAGRLSRWFKTAFGMGAARHKLQTDLCSEGKPFDPHLHQAIMPQPSADFPATTVFCPCRPVLFSVCTTACFGLRR